MTQTADPAKTEISQAPESPRVAVVAGGYFSDSTRSDVALGNRPRIDVLELESRLGASVYDLADLSQTNGGFKSVLTKGLTRAVGRRSQVLAWHLLDAIRDQDVVYATGEDVGYPLAVLMRAFRVDKPALVVRLDQATLGRTALRRMAGNAYIDTALKRIDVIGAHSDVQEQYLTNNLHIAPERIRQLPPRVDLSFYDPDIEDPAEDEIIPESPYILSGGMEERDYDTLIAAVEGLPVTLVIGAASPWSRFSYKGPRDLPPNVQISAFTPRQMRRLYRCAEFSVVPVRPTLRTCGITVLLESWAMRRAVIATGTVGLMAHTREGAGVQFVAPGDVRAMRDAVTALLKNNTKAAQMAEAGSQFVEANGSLDRVVELTETVLADAIENRRLRRG